MQSALGLTPNDGELLALWADVQPPGDSSRTRLRIEQGSAEIHAMLAQSYETLFELAAARSDSIAALEYYNAAMAEHDSTIQSNPRSPEVLWAGAYFFWKAHLKAYRYNWVLPTTLPDAFNAEQWARDATAIATLKRLKELPYYRGTLGEVLLALGRPYEAEEVLKQALRDTSRETLRSPASDELRWDLAQAYLRLAELSSGEATRSYERQAWGQFRHIQWNERDREYAPFSRKNWSLDPTRKATAGSMFHGFSIEQRAGGEHVYFKMAPPTLSDSLSPDMLVDVDAFDLGGNRVGSSFRVRVWGGGVYEETTLRPDMNERIMLTIPARTSHDYFFIQLERSEGVDWAPASIPASFSTDSIRRLTKVVFRAQGP